VNAEILRNQGVATEVRGLEDARAAGATALFGEKYGDRVRVVTVPGFSVELCGGTHARRTGDIGLFKVLSEGGIAAGVRRIEAATGANALRAVREGEEAARAVAAELRTSPERALEAVKRLLEERSRLQKDLADARKASARAATRDPRDHAVAIDGGKLVAAEFAGDAKAMREEADRIRDSLGSAVVVLVSRDGGAVRLVVAVSKDLAGSRYNAGSIIGALAAMVGGKGGGRPDLAQAGGSQPERVPEMLAAAQQVVTGA
jgi:alanyl-tRNA synthetase